jgi:hypothetical protein
MAARASHLERAEGCSFDNPPAQTAYNGLVPQVVIGARRAAQVWPSFGLQPSIWRLDNAATRRRQ